MNEEMALEMVCQFLTLVGFIFGLVSLKIEIDSSNVFLTRLRISYMESGAPKQKRGKKWKM